MRMDCPHQLFDGGLKLDGSYRLGDQFGRLRANDMYAENLAIIGIRDDFDKPFVLADNRSTGIRSERKFSDFEVIARLSRSFFGQADATDLRMAIRGAGNMLGIDRP